MASLEIQNFLDIPYVYRNGPDRDIHPLDGINCQRLVHVFYQRCLGIILSPEQKSLEIYQGGLFRPVENEPIWVGDVFCFGSCGLADMRRLHLGVYIGEGNEPVILHANRIDEKVSIWNLSDFAQHPRYEHVFGVRRYSFADEAGGLPF